VDKSVNDDSPSIEEAVAQQVKKLRKELNSGTVALVLLTVMSKAQEPLYGYQIAKQLESAGGEKQGSLYPVLRNMSTKGLLDSYVVPSDSGPPRKYFQISPLGRAVLKEWLEIWQQTQSFVNHAIGDFNGK
jgi:PadR family transcriptional regulator PadR